MHDHELRRLKKDKKLIMHVRVKIMNQKEVLVTKEKLVFKVEGFQRP